jgi:hypothetical protein
MTSVPPPLQCAGEPISYLRLEMYLLGELPLAERERVGVHIGECSVCRACLDELRASEIQLPELPSQALGAGASVRARAMRSRRWTVVMSAVAMAAAALLFVRLRPKSSETGVPLAFEIPPSHVQVKGGELALSLVRERDGDIALAIDQFAPGDRFTAFMTCPPAERATYWDLVVVQANHAYFPLATLPLSCGNHVTLPGAFKLDGASPASVCIVIDPVSPIDRTALRADKALPESSACVTLKPIAASAAPH